jgi:Gnt-I system low-affinity gluconate transporter
MSGPLWTILVIAASVAVVVLATLKLRLPAFFALLLVAIGAGLAFGADPLDALASVRKGAGEALGFVAVILGLGSLFGALLEVGGGVESGRAT